MPAAVYVGDGAIEVQEIPVPEAGTGRSPRRVSHCGICGTDLHLVLEKYARPGSVLGHEWAGDLAAVGADVARLGARRARRRRPRARLRHVPRVHAGPAVGVPAARTARSSRLLARRLLQLQGRGRVPPAARPRRAHDPRGRAHRAHRDRAAHGQPVRRHTRRPGARHRSRSGRTAHDRGPAGARRPRHHGLGTRSPAPRTRARGRRARRARARRAPPRTDGAPGRGTVHVGVRVFRATRARPRPRSTSSTTRARSCSSAPATTCRASTTTV